VARATQIHDPYGGCTAACSHDLAAGVLISDLLRTDGPHVAYTLTDARRPLLPVTELRRAG